MNIDIKNITCFGFQAPQKKSWLTQSRNLSAHGLNNIDKTAFEKSLADNVKFTYENLISISFVDLDTNTNYLVGFENKLKLWHLTIPDTTDEAIDENDKKEFFKSDIFKKICKRSIQIMTQAFDICKNHIMPIVSKGEFINLDEIKLEAILALLDDPTVKSNIKQGKHI